MTREHDYIRYAEIRQDKKLEAAGMATKEAEALAEAQSDAFSEMMGVTELATKSDLIEMKYDLLKWVIGLALAQFALMVGILLRLPH